MREALTLRRAGPGRYVTDDGRLVLVRYPGGWTVGAYLPEDEVWLTDHLRSALIPVRSHPRAFFESLPQARRVLEALLAVEPLRSDSALPAARRLGTGRYEVAGLTVSRRQRGSWIVEDPVDEQKPMLLFGTMAGLGEVRVCVMLSIRDGDWAG
jgi:hypothetical protein